MKQGTLFYDRECGRYNFHYKDEEGTNVAMEESIVEKFLSLS